MALKFCYKCPKEARRHPQPARTRPAALTRPAAPAAPAEAERLEQVLVRFRPAFSREPQRAPLTHRAQGRHRAVLLSLLHAHTSPLLRPQAILVPGEEIVTPLGNGGVRLGHPNSGRVPGPGLFEVHGAAVLTTRPRLVPVAGPQLTGSGHCGHPRGPEQLLLGDCGRFCPWTQCVCTDSGQTPRPPRAKDNPPVGVWRGHRLRLVPRGPLGTPTCPSQHDSPP